MSLETAQASRAHRRGARSAALAEAARERMADAAGGAMSVDVRTTPSPIASTSTAATNPATALANVPAASRSELFRTSALAAVRAAELPPLPASVLHAMSMSARIALVGWQLIEAGDAHSFLLAAPVDGATDLANASSLASVVKALMPATSFLGEAAASWIRALCSDTRLRAARSTTWAGTILFTEAATPERAVLGELTFIARDSNEQRPRPFLGVRYAPSDLLVPRVARMHELGLLGVSVRAALTIVESAARTILPRLLPAVPLQPALAVVSDGLAELARRMVGVMDAIPVGQMRTMVDSVWQRLGTAVGREHIALVRETAQWLRAGAGAAPQGSLLLAWFKSMFLLDAAAGLLGASPLHADESRQTARYPIQLVGAQLPPTPVLAAAGPAGPRSPPARAKRPRSSSAASAEDLTAMDAGELDAFGLQLTAQQQLLAEEHARRASSTATPAPTVLRQRNY